MKQCSSCNEHKLEDEFRWTDKTKARRRGQCKKCCAIKEQERKENRILEDKDAWQRSRREAHLKNRYNLTSEQVVDMLSNQDGRCAICRDEILLDRFKYAIDHDHSCCSGRNSCGKCVRGILCSGCNKFIGFAKESTTILMNAIVYIERKKE